GRPRRARQRPTRARRHGPALLAHRARRDRHPHHRGDAAGLRPARARRGPLRDAVRDRARGQDRPRRGGARHRSVQPVPLGPAAVTGAEKVAFRFTMVEHDMGEQELVAAERAPGEYVADGSPASMFGTWRLQAIVRIAGREDVSTIFTFPVGAAVAGTGSNSQVLTIGTYTAIVFTDPATPQAG